jgi:alkylation response protein AidB-like acyl-CoA dehydrogenase
LVFDFVSDLDIRISNLLKRRTMSPADSQKLLADVNAFSEEIRPIEELCYLEHQFNDHVVPLARKHNILGMLSPAEYGGRGADAVTYLRALARIGREGTGVRTFFSGHVSIGSYPVLTWGNMEQKQRYLPAAARGDMIMAFGLTEPDAGSNPLEMTTTYERRGDKYILNGVKYLISNAGIADAVIVFGYPAEVGRIANPSYPRRVSAFILDMKQPGVECEDLTAKMGMPSANTGMFEMRDAEVPLNNMLGAEGDGFRIAMGTLVAGRLSVAAGCLGVIEDCLIEAVGYAKERMQHGKPIARHQLVQEHIAHIEMHRVMADAIVMKAAAAKDASTAAPGGMDLAREADLLAAKAKLFASNAAWDAADRAVQILGGRGWSFLYRPGRHLVDTRVCRIYEGTDEILRLKIAAAVLGKGFEAFK